VFFVVLTAAVFAIGETLRTETAVPPAKQPMRLSMVAAEGAMYAGYPRAMTEAPRRQVASKRTLAEFQGRRAYAGAPPVIPHSAGAEGVIADGCVDCHENGGYVPPMKAYAPVTPHPQYANCRQCHVPANRETALFRPTDWERPAPPERQIRAMPGAPLVMPHGTQLRESCVSCHAGPGAVGELRVTHPERTNCRQCHVPPETGELFARAVTDGGNNGR
jgi:cytochrome c-type protein NapB